MMHKESPPEKNSFLEDLDKLDVSIYDRVKTSCSLKIHKMCHQDTDLVCERHHYDGR